MGYFRSVFHPEETIVRIEERNSLKSPFIPNSRKDLFRQHKVWACLCMSSVYVGCVYVCVHGWALCERIKISIKAFINLSLTRFCLWHELLVIGANSFSNWQWNATIAGYSISAQHRQCHCSIGVKLLSIDNWS